MSDDITNGRQNDLIIIGKLSAIETTLGFVKEIIEKHSNDIDEIKDKLNSHGFQNLKMMANRAGDIQEIIRVCSKEYHGMIGFSVLESLLENHAEFVVLKIEMKKSFWKGFSSSLGSFCRKTLPLVIVVSFVVIAIISLIFQDQIALIMDVLKKIK